jgi:hypothetical protein
VDDRAANLYLDLLKKCLTRYEFGEGYRPAGEPETPWKREPFRRARTFLGDRGVQMMELAPFDPALREIGRDWPPEAETIVGLRRLANVQECVVDVLRRGVPGDLMETGVWRGGTVIFMRAILAAFGETTRTVWVADSFQGLPKPSGRYGPTLPTTSGDSTCSRFRRSKYAQASSDTDFSTIGCGSLKAGSRTRSRARRSKRSRSPLSTATCTSRRSSRSTRCIRSSRRAVS